MKSDGLQLGEQSAEIGGATRLASAGPTRAARHAQGAALSRLQTLLILAVLFLAAWLPRSLALDRFVTIDERKWLARSANFYQAISHADWAHTFQREHPGVTVMWAGTLALLQWYPDYAWQAPGQFTWEREHYEAWLQENTPHTGLELLVASRRVIVLIISLVLAIGFLPLRRLLGAWPAALATLFIAWDPFSVGLSQQLHPDGFVAVLTYLALILWLLWLYGGQRRRDLVGAGVVMGLAWLTKTPAIFVVPTGALLVGFELFRDRHRSLVNGQWSVRDALRKHPALLTGFVRWGALATLTFVLLWPAMWMDPLGTLVRMSNEMSEYVERHTTLNYFWGRPVEDPGPLLYPVAFLFRTTPAVLVGLLAALVAGWRRFPPFDQPRIRQSAWGLLLFAVILAAGMTLGAKKFDRYLLPAFPALTIIAALGWVALLQGGWQRFVGWRQGGADAAAGDEHAASTGVSAVARTGVLGFVAVFLLHGLLGFVHYPYYLTYFNPLLGGARTAPAVMIIGWGEGIDETARWLNRQPDADQLRVTAWYADGPFSYFFRGQAIEPSYSSPLFWVDNDFVVLYVNQWQRQLPSPEIVDYFMAQPPAYSVRSGGMELARVYDMRTLTPPDFAEVARESAADFGGQIRLSGAEGPPAVLQPGDAAQVTLYLQSLAAMTVNYNILVRLVGQDGNELWREEGWPWAAPTSDWPVRTIRPDGHTTTIPTAAVPGLYKLTIGFYDPGTFEPLPVTARNGETVLDPASWDVALLRVGEPPTVTAPLDPPWRLGDFFELRGVTLPQQAQAGSELTIKLDWAVRQRSGVDYTTFVHIVDAAGSTVAQQDQPPLAGFAPTRLWTPGLQLSEERRVPLPLDLPPGEYEVRLGFYTGESGRLPVFRGDQPAGDYVVVGAFSVP